VTAHFARRRITCDDRSVGPLTSCDSAPRPPVPLRPYCRTCTVPAFHHPLFYDPPAPDDPLRSVIAPTGIPGSRPLASSRFRPAFGPRLPTRQVIPPWDNRWLLGAIATSMALHFFILYVPPAAALFGVTALSGHEWLAVL
jgi:hypothetical protein